MSSAIYNITIPAPVGTLDGILNWPVSGRFFHVLSASSSFRVSADGGNEITVQRFSGFGDHTRTFNRLTFYNSAATSVSATVYVGDTPYSDAQTNATVIASEYSFEHTQIHEGSLGAGASVTIPMIQNNRFVHSVTVTNFNASLWLYLRDNSSLDNFYAIGPGQTIEQIIGGGANELELHNPNGSAVNCLAAAKYYF